MTNNFGFKLSVIPMELDNPKYFKILIKNETMAFQFKNILVGGVPFNHSYQPTSSNVTHPEDAMCIDVTKYAPLPPKIALCGQCCEVPSVYENIDHDECMVKCLKCAYSLSVTGDEKHAVELWNKINRLEND